MPSDEMNYFGKLKKRGDSFLGPVTAKTNRLGIAELNQPLYCFFEDMFILTPIYGSRHPNPAFGALTAKESTQNQLRGKYARIDTAYAGAQSQDAIDKAEPTYTTKVSQRTEPVETSLRFDDLIEAVKAKFGDTPDVIKYDDDGNFVRFGTASGEMKGVTSFLAGSLTYTINFVDTKPTDRIDRAYTIDTPIGPYPKKNGGKWLLIDVQQQQQGFVYDISLTWLNGSVRGLQEYLYTRQLPT